MTLFNVVKQRKDCQAPCGGENQCIPTGLLSALPGIVERGAKHLTSIEVCVCVSHVRTMSFSMSVSLACTTSSLTQVGAENVAMKGRLRLSLRPLVPSLPVVGAFRVALWEMPDLHFDVTALGGQLALLPMLKTWLYDAVKSAAITPYLAPGGFQMTLAKVCTAIVVCP